MLQRPIASLLVICALLFSTRSYSDNKKGGKQLTRHDVQEYIIPEPDQLDKPLLPDEPMPLIPEVRLSQFHTPSHRYGIDVSHYQGSINWEMVKTDEKARFVYVKATESSGYVDNTYLRNFTGAKRAGIPVGVYHFFSPTASVLTQLQNFKDNVDPRQQDLIPVIDVEKFGRTSIAEFQARLKMFLSEVEKIYGVKPIIYTGTKFYEKYLVGSFTNYKFFIARYHEDAPCLVDDVPIVLWQYTPTGSVNGIRGKVDCSCFLDNFTLNDIRYRHQ